MRFLKGSFLIFIIQLALASCGDEPPAGVRKEYREQVRDPATLSDFTALYHLDSGTVAGKVIQPNPDNYNIKGLAELKYFALDRTAVLRMAACVQPECGQPGGTIAVTSPTLLLTKLTDRAIWFQTAPGAVTAVTLWGEGIQPDGHPFALAMTANGEIPFDLTAIPFPYE